MKLIILFIACSTVFNQELTCPEPPQDCRLPCPLGTCCTCQNPCPATCNDTIPTPCPTLWCNPGCYKICPECHVLNQIGGYCIPLEMCEEDEEDDCCTRHNEIYYECKPCIGTCRAPKPNCTLELCGEPAGCDCEEGLVRDEKTGKCVNPDSPSCKEQRGTQCGPNEVLAACGSAICQENRCDNSTIACPQLCAEPPLGFCVCKEGLYRDTNTELCVDPNEKSCRNQRNGTYICLNPDEQFYPCATKTCFPSCKDPNPICPEICFIPGNCHCKEGLVRDTETGNCVTPDDPSCIAQRTPVCNITGEQYYFCSTAGCERTCQQPVVGCPKICNQPGNCDCKPELVRDITTNQCVDMDSPSCKNQRCRADQKYYPCSTKACFPTCDNLNPFCIAICIAPGNCDCKPGLVRTEHGDCIKPESCPLP